jgi:hypothetical protein
VAITRQIAAAKQAIRRFLWELDSEHRVAACILQRNMRDARRSHGAAPKIEYARQNSPSFTKIFLRQLASDHGLEFICRPAVENKT